MITPRHGRMVYTDLATLERNYERVIESLYSVIAAQQKMIAALEELVDRVLSETAIR
ncbi:hypothetical protein ACFOET_07425 [Parapedobacter deserti]|uniref:Uncharacterized protein n=1 Tax=Parapedobacter deserti TaxID=1912957 RepID=A0ABV7JHI8_9SPHI